MSTNVIPLRPPAAYQAFCEAVETLDLVTRDNEREGDYATAMDALHDCLGDFQEVRKHLGAWIHEAARQLAASREDKQL